MFTSYYLILFWENWSIFLCVSYLT
jgi:hypothetical protein